MFNFFQTAAITDSGLAGTAFYLNSRDQQLRPVLAVWFIDWVANNRKYAEKRSLLLPVVSGANSGWEHVM